MSENGPLILARVQLKNVRSFKDVDIDFLREGKPRNLTVLIGENGSGKSSILRAIAVGLSPRGQANALISKLSGSFIRKKKQGNIASGAKITLTLIDPENVDRTYTIKTFIDTDDSGKEYAEKLVDKEFPWGRVFTCGYGVNRGSTRFAPLEDYKVEDAVRTLFDDNAVLLDPESTLRNLKLAQSENGSESTIFSDTIRHLKIFFGLNPNHEIEVNSERVLVHGPWAPMPFHALGDGYRGTAGWLLDLLGRAHKAGHSLKKHGPRGIVLLDELDEHLHPTWQKRVVLDLKKRLPGIQFIGTTHSPLTILNCDHDEVLVCRLKNAVGKVESKLPQVSGRTADELLKGEWFGLSSTLDRSSENLLKRYDRAVRLGASEEDLGDLRQKVRDRLGYLVATPLDETIMKMASELRDDALRGKSDSERLELIKKGMNALKHGGAAASD